MSRIHRTVAETLALCDYTRAKRTDPTTEQQKAARAKWGGPWVLKYYKEQQRGKQR